MKILRNKEMGHAEHGWLHSIFHFSFADYYDPNHMNFGVLRVVNDDIIEPHHGFEMHPHRDMEIISYVLEGELSHKDSMGHSHAITRGQVQYMSAGTGIYHSEHNVSNNFLRLLQIWIYPDKHGYTPQYGDYPFTIEDSNNQWNHLVSSTKGDAPIKIHQDLNIYVGSYEPNQDITFTCEQGRALYVVVMEGEGVVEDVLIHQKDAITLIEESLHMVGTGQTHIMVIEMSKEGKK